LSTAGAGTSIVVCVPTFRRNDMLRDCLAGIGRLTVPDGCRVEVVVADNDPDGGARGVVDAARSLVPFPLHYCREPERGVASIRNRLVDEALRLEADWLALLDDDEVPEPAWLVEHARALARFGAHVSSGPALPAGGPDAAAAQKVLRRETGSTPRHVATNNVVFRRVLVAEQGLRFDTRFNLIGGVDFDFFDRSRALGNVHVWVAEARVWETIPPERATWRYLFYRHYSGAINAVARFRKQHSGARAWLHFGIKAAGKLFGALWALLSACVHAPRENLRAAVKRLANAAGYVAALCGLNAERYR
jgi:glycosyltransferase involved in cell wall biosynthesis